VSQVVTLEDGVVTGGFGSGVMELLSSVGLAKTVATIGVPDRFLPFGSPTDIMTSVGMDPDSVVARVLVLLGR
jgi:1-deoxy-D-xylulose-5-phosphate synthase